MRPHRSMSLGLVLIAVATSGCTLRYAHSTFSDPALDEGKTGVTIEAGGYLWDGTIFGQRADGGLFGVYQRFDFFTDAAASHIEGRLRWFPLRPRLVDPFVAAGLGVHRLNRTESDTNCLGRGICVTGRLDQRGQATGLTPHVVVGTEIRPGGSRVGLVAAVAREFGVFDPEWDLSAWRVSAGLVFRPR